ncbi:hypothetical protein DPMN_027850 [Dreissena polymorpha]|uniref:Uncharacterized protein n=1 Tax=Dreissena polymorpha TaxID=45954 RepID=A0A9D4LW37_DREPO|nr:hypothetical protein DPMN_027850 [Dreissena polymorpha]
MKGFLPHCGRSRPVVLIMDNHDADISLPVIDAARANNVVLIGVPYHAHLATVGFEGTSNSIAS